MKSWYMNFKQFRNDYSFKMAFNESIPTKEENNNTCLRKSQIINIIPQNH